MLLLGLLTQNSPMILAGLPRNGLLARPVTTGALATKHACTQDAWLPPESQAAEQQAPVALHRAMHVPLSSCRLSASSGFVADATATNPSHSRRPMEVGAGT